MPLTIESVNMMSRLLTLKTVEEWEKFKADFLLQHGIEANTVMWGDTDAPSSFPCLVSGTIVDISIVCVFVYLDDAKQLLLSAGHTIEVEEISPVDEVDVETEQTSVWSRHMVAFFLAMLHELISVGITKEERFEPLVAQMLSLVDKRHAMDLEKVKELIGQEFRRETG